MIRPARTTRLATAATLLLACAMSERSVADVITLKNGSKIEGTAHRTVDGWTITDVHGVSTDLSADSVAGIEVGRHSATDAADTTQPGSSLHTPAVAESNLASLRRSVEALNSPTTVIERYRRFIDQNAGTPAVIEAKQDLVTWQDRQDRGLVKVGQQWVTPAQKQEMATHAGDFDAQAAKLIDQGRMQDADALLTTSLEVDPQNAAAYYLRGLILFQQNQVVNSRKAFESSIAATPVAGPSLNNLAVILSKQNQTMGSLQTYDRSLTALPLDKIVHDNIAEALAALPADQRKNPIAIRLQKHFDDEDARLQAILAKSGQYRWGATWVDQATLDKLKGIEKQINDKLTQLNADATTANNRIGEIDKLTSQNNATMSQLQASSFSRDTEGHVVQLPMPPAFYTLQNENERLAAERGQLQQKLQGLADEAKKAQQSMPVPRYTGVERMIGTDGMPGVASTQPSTQPTTQSSTQPTTGRSTANISIGPASTQTAGQPTTAPQTPAYPTSGPVLIPLP